MKQLCMVNYVWGDYQMYIPLYLLFLGTSYPDYDAYIYVDKELTENVKKQLDIVKTKYLNFHIITGHAGQRVFSKEAERNSQILRCQRWLNYTEEYENYESIYLGDIDILICQEPRSIFDSHQIHCKTINRVYSNAARKPILFPQMNASQLLNFTQNHGVAQTIDYLRNRGKGSLRYSGLHFVQTKPYFDAVLPLTDFFYEELEKMAYKRKSLFHAYSFNNEELLRVLIIKAGLGECYPIDIDNLNDPYAMGYRADHGLHLGRYRGREPIVETEDFMSRHRAFYDQYKEIKKTEEYIDMEKLFSNELIYILSNMEAVFERV